jgi:hypothetical protein
MNCQSRPRKSIVTLMLSAAAAGAATLVLGAQAQAQGTQVSGIVVTVTTSPGVAQAPPSIPLKPRVSPSPTTTFQGFADMSPGSSACPASTQPTTSTTPTVSPSVTPTVLGVTFVNPPPSAVSPTTKGRLPFTGLPLTQLLAMAAALVGTGTLLVRSKRRHHLSRH